MAKKLRGVGLGISAECMERLDAYAAKTGSSRSEAMRQAVLVGLPLLERGLSPDIARLLLIAEYLQFAVSSLIDKTQAEDIEKLFAAAQENVERFHG
jgi:metal-responsive CopG/Arc/MetJ family transcriptional regulator